MAWFAEALRAEATTVLELTGGGGPVLWARFVWPRGSPNNPGRGCTHRNHGTSRSPFRFLLTRCWGIFLG